MPKVKPITYDDFVKDLGPGYLKGWYTPKNYGGRKDHCSVDPKEKKMKILKKNYAAILKELDKNTSLDTNKDLGVLFENGYHSAGHNIIGEKCNTVEKETE